MMMKSNLMKIFLGLCVLIASAVGFYLFPLAAFIVLDVLGLAFWFTIIAGFFPFRSREGNGNPHFFYLTFGGVMFAAFLIVAALALYG